MDMTDESYARINWFAIVAQDERLNAKAMAGPRQIIGNLAASLNAEKRTSPHFDSINARVDADLLGRLPSAESVKPLIGLLTRTSGDDIELIHTARMALRDCLVSTGGYAAAEKFLASNPEYADKVADVSLGAKTPEAAEFLLGHLGRTKLQGARSGEFLRHAVLSLPPEKLGAIAGLIENIKDAPLPQRLSVADNLAQAYRQRGLPLPDAITA